MVEPGIFEVFVKNYQDMVFTTAVRLLRNETDAEDIAQEVFLRAHKAFDMLRDNPSAGGWLRQVARNLCLNHLTRYRSRWQLFSDILRPEDGDDEAAEDHLHLTGDVNPPAVTDAQGQVQEALLTLPEKQRVPLVLYHYEDMSYEEIAKVLKISLGQVKTDIHRGRAALKEKIERIRAHEAHAMALEPTN